MKDATFDDHTLDLIREYTDRLRDLITEFDKIRMNFVLSIGLFGVAASIVLAAAVFNLGPQAESPPILDFRSPLTTLAFLAGFGSSAFLLVALAAILYRQYRSVSLQIRVAASALDMLITSGTSVEWAEEDMNTRSYKTLWTVSLAEAKAILQSVPSILRRDIHEPRFGG